MEGLYEGVPTSGRMGADGLWARFRGGASRVLLLLRDSVTGLLWPPVVAAAEEAATAWAALFAQARRAGLVLEDLRVVVLSVTEGEDKPIKYPLMFRVCDAALLNKIDLLPHLDYNKKEAVKNILQVNPSMPIFEISAKTEEGFDSWIAWLTDRAIEKLK